METELAHAKAKASALYTTDGNARMRPLLVLYNRWRRLMPMPWTILPVTV